MKKLSMVVHSSLQQELADCLRNLDVGTFIFNHVEEHSSQLEHDAFLSVRDKVEGYVPQIRVDVILENDRAHSLLEAIRQAPFSFNGKGYYWIVDLDSCGEL